MAIGVLLGGYGAAFAAGSGAAAFGMAGEGRSFRRILGVALAGWMSVMLSALGSILGVLAAAMHEAGHAGAAAAAQQMFMLVLAVLAAMVVSSALCRGMAVTVVRQGREDSLEERAR